MGEDKQPRRWRKWCAIGSALVLLLVVLTNLPKGELPPLPDPNGYDDFLKAGEVFVEPGTNFWAASEDQVNAWVKANENALRLIEEGLGKEIMYDPNADTKVSYDPLLRCEDLSELLIRDSRISDPSDVPRKLISCLMFGNSIQVGAPFREPFRQGLVIETRGLLEIKLRMREWQQKELNWVRERIVKLKSRRSVPDDVTTATMCVAEAQGRDIRWVDDVFPLLMESKSFSLSGHIEEYVQVLNGWVVEEYDETIAAIDARLETLEKSGDLDL